MLGKSGRNDKDDDNQPPSWLDTSYDREFAVNVAGDHGDGDGGGDDDDARTSLLLQHRHDSDEEEDLATSSSKYSQMEVDRNDQNRGKARGRRAKLVVEKHDSNSEKHRSSIQDMWSHYGTMMSKNKSDHDDDDDEEEHPFRNVKSDLKRKRQHQKTKGVFLKDKKPRRSCGLQTFYLLESSAILTWLGLFVSQILPFVLFSGGDNTSSSNDDGIRDDDGNGPQHPSSRTIMDHPVDLALRIFISIFSCLFMVVEYDPPIRFIRKAGFLQTYISRGFLYEFFGLVCLQQSYSEFVNDMIEHRHYNSMMMDQQREPAEEESFHVAWFPLFVQISAYCVCALGVLYCCMGLFCLKRQRDRLYREHKQKWDDYRDRQKRHWEENPYI